MGLGRRGCAHMVLVGLCLTSGCAFPIFHTESRDARAFAYAPQRQEHSRPPSLPPNERTHTTTRREASVLSPVAPEPGAEHQDMAHLSSSACFEELTRLGGVYEQVPAEEAGGVAMPMRLLGPLGGVIFAPSDKSKAHAILDCRLALALHAWAQDLRKDGVVRVDHYSMYRANAHVAGDGRISGHAHGMAIDAARFTLEDGTQLDVLDDWEGREHGGAPCPVRPDEAFGSRLLRSLTCEAVDQRLFQIVITPHHDKAHNNHVHLECKPEVDWTYVR